MKRTIQMTMALVFVVLCAALSFAQVSTTGAIAGTITDPTGAVVPGATVVVKNNATGAETTVKTADNGTFNVPALPSGVYTVTITATSGFKQSIVRDVKVDVGTPSSVSVALEVGGANESVTIVGGGELLQTQTATVGTTITGRQITDLPFTSRDALDLVLLLPGTNTPGSPRTSTVNGLPKGSLNITIDGVNVQDNTQKSAFGGGFFTYIRPRIDAIDEVTVSTATPGAESNGEGAVQIKFVTRGGSNDFHGSAYWYHRNPALNANYYFNNLAGLARDRVLLNQFGGRAGGPITIPKVFNGKDRAFFFTNYEEYRLPEQTSRQRTILNPLAETGVFTTSSGATINLLTEAAATNCNPAGATATNIPCTSTIDPTVSSILGAIRGSVSQGSVRPLDNYRQTFSFTNTGGQQRRFATVRFDYNLTSKHHIENIWNYQVFRNKVDFLNNADPAYPGSVAGIGGQNSNRFSDSMALRSTFSSNVVNEARFGLQGGISLFRAESSPASFSAMRGFAFGSTVGSTTTGFGPAGLNNPVATRSNSRNNSPVKQFTDNLTWTAGKHTFNFGGALSQYNLWSKTTNSIVPVVTFGLNTTDPATRIFTRSAFTGLSSSDLAAAQNLYAVLTGRVTSIAANAYVNEETGNLKYIGDYVERVRQREFGLYAQDSYRFRPNITLNYGLRWEVQFPYQTLNSTYSQTTFPEIFGISGQGNLFRPGVQTGKVTQFTQFTPGMKAYRTDWGNFAPSVGFSYSPDWKEGLMGRLFGTGGQTVLRAGYSIAYVREGLSVAQAILGSNPGGIFDVSRTVAGGNLDPGTLFRTIDTTNASASFPQQVTFPFTGTTSSSANAFEPNLKTGYVQSWSAGIQREIGKDNVVEIRYVGNRGVKLWQQIDLNEINLVENGYINEFIAAQQNLLANIAAGRGTTFRYAGPGTGTSPLPVTLAYISGVAPANAGNCTATGTGAGSCAQLYNNSLFTNTTLISNLLPNNAAPQGFVSEGVGGFAANLINNAGRRANAITAGLPANYFIVNPDYIGGGAFLVTNRGRSYYDGLTVEFRRRMAQGLLLNANYTFSKATSNMFASSLGVFYQPATLRSSGRLDKNFSPFDITHGFKASWIYELPFGRGKTWLENAGGLVDRLAGGWAVHGTTRWQSGTPFSLGNVQLVGMTRSQLEKAVQIRQAPTGEVFYLPDDIILNTRRAFSAVAPVASSTNPFAVSGYSSLGIPEGRYIAPANSNGCIAAFVGQCGFRNLVIHGPHFFRTDLSVVKTTKLTEKTNVEFRAEFLNAFNNINFRIGGAGTEVNTVTNFTSAAFGQTTQAYRDISTTNDPGGRIIQFVLRVNF